MSPLEHDPEDDEVAEMAVQALKAANRSALESGLPMVLVRNGTLIRIDASGITELEKLPPRQKVSDRVKRASS